MNITLKKEFQLSPKDHQIYVFVLEKTYMWAVGVFVSQPCLTYVTSWTVTNQPPLSMEFSRQEYWSGLLFPSPGDLPHPGFEPGSPALAGGFFTI